MKKKAKPDPAQLELWQDYRAAQDGLQTALDRLIETGNRLQQAGLLQPAEAKTERKQIVKKVDHELRERFVAVVQAQAREKQMHWRHIFGAVYRILWEDTGFNAMARAIAAGKGTKRIDVVEQHGYLPHAIKIAAVL